MQQIPEITSEYTEIRRDGEYVTTVHSTQILAWFHQNHSYSVEHALRYEGYEILPVEERWVFFEHDRIDGVWQPEVVVPKKSQRAAKMACNRYNGNAFEYGYRMERKHNGTWRTV